MSPSYQINYQSTSDRFHTEVCCRSLKLLRRKVTKAVTDVDTDDGVSFPHHCN